MSDQSNVTVIVTCIFQLIRVIAINRFQSYVWVGVPFNVGFKHVVEIDKQEIYERHHLVLAFLIQSLLL